MAGEKRLLIEAPPLAHMKAIINKNGGVPVEPDLEPVKDSVIDKAEYRGMVNAYRRVFERQLENHGQVYFEQEFGMPLRVYLDLCEEFEVEPRD